MINWWNYAGRYRAKVASDHSELLGHEAPRAFYSGTAQKQGRARGLLNVLAELEKEGYIEWSPLHPERITLIQAWER